MPYTKQTWADYDSATPLSAARLAHIEDGVLAAGDPVAEEAARLAADNAESAARTAADTAHLVASDPHGDRAYADADVLAHTTGTDPHGDRAAAVTDATARVAVHTAATDPHGDRADATATMVVHTTATDPHGDRADAAGRYAAKSLVAASPQAASPATYNPVSNVYNLKSKHLVRTRAGLARVKAGTGFLKIGTQGDSTTAGWGAVAGMTDWPSQLLSILNSAGYSAAGSLIPGYHNISTDTRVTLTTGWVHFGETTNMLKNNANTNAATFATPACTAVTVYFNNGTPAGTIVVTIDGGTPVTVTPTSGISIGSWTSGALANTTHSVAVASGVGSGQVVYIQGVEARQSTTSGVRLFNVAIGGTVMSQQSDIAYFSCGPAVATGYACDLIIIMSEVNDSLAVPATYQSQLQTAITTARASGADVILGTAFPCTSGIVFPGITTAIYNLADANDLPVVDFGSRWNNNGALIAAQGLMFDEKHGNPVGYLDFASHMAKVLL